MRYTIVLLGIYLKFTNIYATDCSINRYEKYYSSYGDVFIVGLFNAHKDENCSSPNPIILQEMYHIAVTVKLLNSIKYIPGINIGMSLYDTCATKEIAQKSLISSLVDINCNIPYNLGILSSDSVTKMIGDFAKVANIPIFTLDNSPNVDMLLKISIQLMKNLQYNTVDIALFPNQNLIKKFDNITVLENICVRNSYTFSQFDEICPGENRIVFITVTFAELSPLLNLKIDCMSTFIIAILDNNIDLSSVTEHLFLHEAYLIIPSNIWPEFAISVEDDFDAIVTTVTENLNYSNVTMDFIRTASTVISIIDHLKQKLRMECGNQLNFSLCSNLTKFRKVDEQILNNNRIFSVPELFGIEKRNVLQYLILKSHFNSMNNYGKIKISGDEIIIEFVNPMLHSEIEGCDWTTENCQNCSNVAQQYDIKYKIFKIFNNIIPFTLKSNGWVSSVLTICIIGVISCLCVFIFIFGRVCKGDILEGNPSSTFLLIVGNVLTYLTVLPFSIQAESSNKILCVVKLFGTSITYCFLFSVILSRTLMILTCDYNGSFMSHINGYLQSFLCFFIFSVQFGLILEFWIFSWVLSEIDYCNQFLNNNAFLLYLIYDTLLLILITIMVFFITKSRRNYKEGLCFTALSVCLVVIWILWTFGYFIVLTEWKDFCVAAGLTGSATAIVICVLIPRTYLIVTGIVRDRITSAIPANISNLMDINYRSTQALYDNVNLDTTKKGELNIGYYGDPQSSSSISHLDVEYQTKTDDITNHVLENNYETCNIPIIEQKITKF
ncbi:hypothetical protein PGB90_009831 [Kerria lacca]